MSKSSWTPALNDLLRAQVEAGIPYDQMTGFEGRRPSDLVRRSTLMGFHTPEVAEFHRRYQVAKHWPDKTAAMIAHKLHIPIEEVSRIAAEIGLPPRVKPMCFVEPGPRPCPRAVYSAETMAWVDANPHHLEARVIRRMIDLGHARSAA